jgi:hypothetical protein
MFMTASNSSTPKKNVYPPGTVIPILDFSVVSSSISLSNNKSYDLLQPLVAASLDATGNIQVSTVVFVDASLSLVNTDFIVNQLYDISDLGFPRIQFFISYEKPETKPTEFKAYEISFSPLLASLIPAVVIGSQIKTVQVFIWNVDPKTSRGTETVVQHST